MVLRIYPQFIWCYLLKEERRRKRERFINLKKRIDIDINPRNFMLFNSTLLMMTKLLDLEKYANTVLTVVQERSWPNMLTDITVENVTRHLKLIRNKRNDPCMWFVIDFSLKMKHNFNTTDSIKMFKIKGSAKL